MVYFVVTENCNLKCKHCYLSAGPEKKDTTISLSDFRKVIDHLPKFSLDLCLSGGEIFTIKNQLYEFLDYVRQNNQQRDNNRELRVILQTNGYWATSQKKIEKIFSELKEFNLSKLEIASNDIWHENQGLNIDKKSNILRSIWRDYFSKEILQIRGGSDKPFPMGRAKRLVSLSDFFKRSYCGYDLLNLSISNSGICIDTKGDVFTCCFKAFQLDGNLVNEPLEDIINRAQKTPRYIGLHKHGIKGLALADGWNEKKLEELISKKGECGFCFQEYHPEGPSKS